MKGIIIAQYGQNRRLQKPNGERMAIHLKQGLQ